MAGTAKAETVLALVCIMSVAFVIQGQNEAADFLTPHNDARAEVGVSALTWDSTLEMYAQNYANQLAASCVMVHSPAPRTYGENLYGGSGGASRTAADAVSAWVSEKSIYESNEACLEDLSCGHYTQVVWRNTKYLGCAKADCSDGTSAMFVCEYYPPGNVVGQKPYD